MIHAVIFSQFAIENVNFYKYSMCLCGNLGLLKESGQYSTLAPKLMLKNFDLEIATMNDPGFGIQL